MSITAISHLVEAEFRAVNETIIRCLESEVETVEKISHYLITSGGKRIRPLVLLLSAKACAAPMEAAIMMAGIIEFIHSATLLHDDVVDSSKLRRGRPTANRVWDNPSAVLVGDFLYSRAFQMMVSLNNLQAMRILADATNMIAEGEVLQLAHRHQPDINESRYLKVIHYKTAKLFEAAAQLGAIMGKQPPVIEQSLATYGLQLGIAFQLIDDLLDYSAENPQWGKNIGTDLAEGKATLPLIYAMEKAPPQEAEQIRQALQAGSSENLKQIQEVISSTGALNYTLAAAKQKAALAKQSLEHLPSSPYKDGLTQLAEFAVSREN